jgi:activating signal cointegrator 1
MKALTLWQPWASLIVDKIKTMETRPMPWYYLGPVAIHAGLRVDREACIRFGYNPDTIPAGAVLGTAMKTGLVHFEGWNAGDAYTIDPYGDYTKGRYGYPLENVVKFDKPIPAKGHQGFWDWVNR